MQMSDFNKERLLEALGLAPRPSTFSVIFGALGTFALGALVGASLGLLGAPRAGRELRKDLKKRLGREIAEIENRIS